MSREAGEGMVNDDVQQGTAQQSANSFDSFQALRLVGVFTTFIVSKPTGIRCHLVYANTLHIHDYNGVGMQEGDSGVLWSWNHALTLGKRH